MKRISVSTRIWVLLWGLGTALGSGLGIAAWIRHAEGAVRAWENLTFLIALPGWVPVYALRLGWLREYALGIVLANAIAWAFWVMLARLLFTLRGRLARPVEKSPEAGAFAGGTGVDRGRRAFLCNAAVGVGGVGAITSPTYATLVEPWSIKVRRYSIPIRGLPASLEGLRLAQFSDSHLGPRIPSSFVRQAVDLVVSLKPDVVLLTGDYVHDGVREIDQAAELCRPMVEAASIGVVGVLGNHDWWGDGARMSRALRDVGVRMIDNDRVWLDAAARRLTDRSFGEALAMVGLGDLHEDVVDTRRAFADVDAQTPRVVLAHNPDTAELHRLARPGSPRVDLMCSGHTHGGQVKIPLLGTPIVPSSYGSKYAGGLVQGPAFPVLVSRGVGMSLLPVRFGVPPEVSLITLTAGS